MAPSYNLKNPAVKRILQEIKEIQADTSGDLMAEALETDIFEWHFAIRGAPDTEFEGGIYHGRILLPAEYPFKPPSFMMLSPSGRFEIGMKICLSISTHHPEQWQPSWSVRTALTALIAFMPTPGGGALGALDYTADERRKLAAKSRQEPPRWGSPERQQIIADMHARMLAAPPQKPVAAPSSALQELELGRVDTAAAPASATPTTPADASAPAEHSTSSALPAMTVPTQRSSSQLQQDGTSTVPVTAGTPAVGQGLGNGGMPTTPVSTAGGAGGKSSLAAANPTVVVAAPTPQVTSSSLPPQAAVQQAAVSGGSGVSQGAVGPVGMGPPVSPAAPADTWALTALALLLVLLIAAILLRKAMVAVGYTPAPSLLASQLDREL